MMQRYQEIRAALPADVFVLFRVGDFYEIFFEDAKTAAKILEVAVTTRNGIPMCGVPYHALDRNVAKLIADGKRVALCEKGEPQEILSA